MSKSKFKILIVTLIILSLSVTGCSRTANEEQPALTVAAASDLQFAFREIGELFTQETGIPVEFNFGSTGLLAQQIINGAPIDVFAAANKAFVDKLREEDLIIYDTQALYAKGRIGVVKKKGTDPGLNWGELENGQWDLLYQTDYRNLAIANPKHAPYGAAAKEFLLSTDAWGKLEDKLIYGSNVRDALNYVLSGNVEIGIIALSIADKNEVDFILIPEELHLPLEQSLAIINSTKLELEAREFTRFVLGARGKEILQKYSFMTY